MIEVELADAQTAGGGCSPPVVPRACMNHPRCWYCQPRLLRAARRLTTKESRDGRVYRPTLLSLYFGVGRHHALCPDFPKSGMTHKRLSHIAVRNLPTISSDSMYKPHHE